MVRPGLRPLPWRGIPGLGPDDTLAPAFPTVKTVGRAGLATVEELDTIERNWCTTPFEPLGGRTPTEAAADRAMRAELGHVLDDMEWLQRHGAVPAMNVSRLRRRLGLT